MQLATAGRAPVVKASVAPADRDRLRDLAQAEQTSISSVVRRLVLRGLRDADRQPQPAKE